MNTLLEIMEERPEIKKHTYAGVTTDIFDNDKEIKDILGAESIGKLFEHLKKEVDTYYGEGN